MVAPWIEYIRSNVEQTGFSVSLFRTEDLFCSAVSIHFSIGSVCRQDKGKMFMGR